MHVMCDGTKYKVIKKQGLDYIVEQPNSQHGLNLALDGRKCTVCEEVKPVATKAKAGPEKKAKTKKKASKKTGKTGKKKK